MESYEHLVVDEPAAGVRRLTLNRPEKRNALNNRLRGELFDALDARDQPFGDYRTKKDGA